MTGNSDAALSGAGASIKEQVLKVMTDHSLCNSLVTRVSYYNITMLLSATAKVGIDSVCGQKPVFATVILSVNEGLFSAPTIEPSSPPTQPPTPYYMSTERNRLYGILAIILFTAMLRLLPAVIDCSVSKKSPKRGHLYDILVVLNNTQEAVLQNIRHEDIAYYRSVTSDIDETLVYEWTMNNMPAPLDKRVEVHFLDQYDLLGHSGATNTAAGEGGAGMGILSSVSTEIAGDKCVTQRMYMHEASLQVGMIIRVIPSPDYSPKLVGAAAYRERPSSGRSQRSGNEGRKSQKEELDSISKARVQTKKVRNRGSGQSFDVLHQLPSCYSTRRPLTDFDNRVVPGPGYIDTLVSSTDATWGGSAMQSNIPWDREPVEQSEGEGEGMVAGRGRGSSFNAYGMRSARQSPSPTNRDTNAALCTSTSVELYTKSTSEPRSDRHGAVRSSERSRSWTVGSPNNLLPAPAVSDSPVTNIMESQLLSDRFKRLKSKGTGQGQGLRRRNSPPSVALEGSMLEAVQRKSTGEEEWVKHLMFNGTSHESATSMRTSYSRKNRYEGDEEKSEDSDEGDEGQKEKYDASLVVSARRSNIYKL